jgi:transposase-like protein
LAGRYLDWALADFSGYIAADELYDGPFCVLSIVDNRTFKRLAYEVLDHTPTGQDITAFFRRFQRALEQRKSRVVAITTDASSLYPEPIAAVFGSIPHQVCQFHMLKEITKVVLRAVAHVRKQVASQKPKLSRGRPSTTGAKRASRQRKRLDAKVGELFDNRYLFVQHHLRAAERKTLAEISRGQKPLLALREVMDEVYRLFDRRCRTETALAKLSRLRRRVGRFQNVCQILVKLNSPNLEKALTFLDDRLLPSTSNAVERGNRRYRKMQKGVYRVRTQKCIGDRIALDMLRDAHRQHREQTRNTLHHARAEITR